MRSQPSVIIPQPNTHPGPGLQQPPHTRETGRTDVDDTGAGASGQGPPGGTDGRQLAPDAASAAVKALSCAVSCGFILLQCCCRILDHLESPDQASGASGLNAGDQLGGGSVPSRPPDADGGGSTHSHSDDSRAVAGSAQAGG